MKKIRLMRPDLLKKTRMKPRTIPKMNLRTKPKMKPRMKPRMIPRMKPKMNLRRILPKNWKLRLKQKTAIIRLRIPRKMILKTTAPKIPRKKLPKLLHLTMLPKTLK